VETGVSANRGIAVAAVAADAGHLKGGLIECHIVCLIGMGTGIVSRHGNIDRIIHCEGRVNDAAIKVSISAVAGVISSACDHIGVNPVVAGAMLRSRRRTRLHQPPHCRFRRYPPTPAIWKAD